MAEKKSIIEEAVLDIQKIKNALNANTKEILRSVAREEIDGLVKESLKENDYEEEVIDGEEEIPDTPEGEPDAEIQSSDDIDPVGQELEMDTDDNPEVSIEDEIDLTGESDDDVIAIYKKLSGEDEVEIVDDEIHITVDEPGEYIVKTGDVAPTDATPDELGDDLGSELGDEIADDGDEEMSYEISMDDDEGDSEETLDIDSEIEDETPASEPEGDSEKDSEEETEEEEEEVVQESIPVGTAQAHRLPGKANIGQPKGAGADNLKESAKTSKPLVNEVEVKYKKLLTEATKLKSENDQFRKALKQFRNMLVETVVFNHNLSYVTKLFMEQSTTKDEKKSIIQRFDNVTSLKESKKLYKTILTELSGKKPVNESVENKIIKEVSTGSSKQLNEATAYVDPSTQRIKDLIMRVENKDKY